MSPKPSRPDGFAIRLACSSAKLAEQRWPASQRRDQGCSLLETRKACAQCDRTRDSFKRPRFRLECLGKRRCEMGSVRRPIRFEHNGVSWLTDKKIVQAVDRG